MPVYNFSSTPLYVDEGQSIQFRYIAPSDFNETTVVTVVVGEYQTLWVIKTAEEDLAPDGFSFQAVDSAVTDLYFTYAQTSSPNTTGPDTGIPVGGGSPGPATRSGEGVVKISGLSIGSDANFSVSSNVIDLTDYGWRIREANPAGDMPANRPWPAFTDGTYYTQVSPPQITVKNGDEIQIYVKSSTAAVDEKTVTVNVGFGSATWRVTTGAPPANIPNPLPIFNDTEPLELGALAYSNIVQISGLNTDANVSVSGAQAEAFISNNNTQVSNIIEGNIEYSVLNNGSGWNTNQVVSNNQYIQLRGVASNVIGSTLTVGVSIGSLPTAATWKVISGAGVDTLPNVISFTNLINQIPGTVNVASNVQTISGVTPGIPLDVILTAEQPASGVGNPRLSINGGSPSAINGSTVFLDDEIQVVLDTTPDLLDNTQAPNPGVASLAISVGDRSSITWQIANWTGPDNLPAFTPLSNTSGWTPGGNVIVGPVGLTDFNEPIQANVTAVDSLGGTPTVFVSIDAGPYVAAPVTIQPNNTGNVILVRFKVLQPGDANVDPVQGLGATSTITYSFGTSLAYTVTQTNYLVKPIPPAFQGCWYSNKNEFFDQEGWEAAGSPAANALSYYRAPKQDGYSIGTVVPVSKEFDGTYGNIEERFPGFVPCDGSQYNISEYPFLFEALGNHYGGNGTTTFRVPDYRNRRLVGDSAVDGNRGASVAVECTYSPLGNPGSGDFTIPGSYGGWWYMAQTDASGPDPLEQVIGTGNTGTSSLFFNLGTVKTFGLSDLEADIPWTVTGTAQADIGVVSEATPTVPQHEHLVPTAQTESPSGDPLIPWGQYAYYRTDQAGGGESPQGEDEPDSDAVYDWWTQYGFNPGSATKASEFEGEIQNTDGGELRDILPLGANGGETSATFGNYWGSSMSPINSLSPTSAYYNGVSGASSFPSAANDAGVIDTTEDFAKIDRYVSIYGNGTSHSHKLSETNPLDPQTDYSFGNQIGAGDFSSNPGFATLFGNKVTLTFFQQAFPGKEPVALELNEGAFSWNNASKPIPSVAMDPQNNVAVPTPFYKVKYIIKAY